jgi:hypothetical protein
MCVMLHPSSHEPAAVVRAALNVRAIITAVSSTRVIPARHDHNVSSLGQAPHRAACWHTLLWPAALRPCCAELCYATLHGAVHSLGLYKSCTCLANSSRGPPLQSAERAAHGVHLSITAE